MITLLDAGTTKIIVNSRVLCTNKKMSIQVGPPNSNRFVRRESWRIRAGLENCTFNQVALIPDIEDDVIMGRNVMN